MLSELSKLATFSPPTLTTNRSHSLLLFSLCKRFLSSSSSLSVPSHEHVVHLILEQKSASKALDTFKWAARVPSFTHSQSTYRALLHKLCTFRRFNIVKQLLDEMPHSVGFPPDEDIFLTIIRGLGRARMIRRVIEVLDVVAKFHKNPSLKILNSILDVLVKEDIDLARKFYRKKMMGNGVQGDDYTFGILMKGLCLTNRIADAFKLLQVLKSRGVKPNTVIYNTLLHSLCKNGKVGRARSLMIDIEEPNDVTFNILISGYCNERNLVQALVLLEKSFNAGFIPDVVTVTKVVEVLCNFGRVPEAVEMLERVESKGGMIDVVTYNTLIRGFCRIGKVKIGHHFLKEMERKGCLPNADTYNELIAGFCESRMWESALTMFNDMKTDGINWNFATFDTLIRGLFSGGRIDDGFKILELMEEAKGISMGRISPYNSVLYGLYKINLWDEAIDFLMKLEKLFPRTVDRSLTILGFCEEGAIEDARRVYDQMISEGGIPSVLIYDRLIHVFCQKGNVREALELVNEMVGCGYFPTPSTVNAVITEFCRQGKEGSGLKLLEDMIGRDFVPDIGSYSSLIEAFCKNSNFQQGLNLFLQMTGRGITPDLIVWRSLLLTFSRETSWLESKNLFHVKNLLKSIIAT
ncbi:hypothetical protein K2173_004957 [Erythroxylum novogranatense]|uniref:Pentatricopeptide repeat-containing protein n=1 Tax=Erythroxylum novogranatense TaxID=1862640 RepID=A0AAV8TCX8_9ROSI|nr:hypothetical protein K2173_004957 [Erythroxylum novogranatense]